MIDSGLEDIATEYFSFSGTNKTLGTYRYTILHSGLMTFESRWSYCTGTLKHYSNDGLLKASLDKNDSNIFKTSYLTIGVEQGDYFEYIVTSGYTPDDSAWYPWSFGYYIFNKQ